MNTSTLNNIDPKYLSPLNTQKTPVNFMGAVVELDLYDAPEFDGPLDVVYADHLLTTLVGSWMGKPTSVMVLQGGKATYTFKIPLPESLSDTMDYLRWCNKREGYGVPEEALLETASASHRAMTAYFKDAGSQPA